MLMNKERKVAELICVGTELLLGNIVNTNAAYIAEKLAGLGIACYYQTVVGDNADRLESTIKLALSRADIIILNGGLGPTEDDLTKEVACKVAGREMYCHEESKEKLVSYFKMRGLELTENNFKQAMMPEGGIILNNNNGTAPGVIIPYENKHIILMPGPPVEMKAMFEESVEPYLKELTPEIFVSQTVKVVSVGESIAETMIKDMIDKQTNPTIATYCKTGEVHIRVTAAAADETSANKLIKPVVKELKSRFGSNVYSANDNVSLEKSVVDLLVSGELKCIVVEAFSGGVLASKITSVKESSEVLKYALIPNTNKSKRKLTPLKKTTIEKHTAVSAEAAIEMVKEAEIGPKADVIVSICGDSVNPDGRVFIACNVCGNIVCKEHHFGGNMTKMRESAAVQALVLMRECVLEYLSHKTFGDK